MNEWRSQCEAARGIKERLGSRKAMGYLVGEKLFRFLPAADRDPAIAAQLADFVAEIKAIFEPGELSEYFRTTRRFGALGHAADDEQFATMREAGAIVEDVVSAAEDAIVIERMRALFLGTH